MAKPWNAAKTPPAFSGMSFPGSPFDAAMDGTRTESLAALVMVESCVSGVDFDYAGLDAGDLLPEVLSVDVGVIKVIVTLEFHGESLFDDGRPNSLIAWIPAYKTGTNPES